MEAMRKDFGTGQPPPRSAGTMPATRRTSASSSRGVTFGRAVSIPAPPIMTHPVLGEGLQPQAFQVARLRHGEQDRVVLRLPEHAPDADRPPRVARRRAADVLEERRAHVVRAGERGEEPAGPEAGEGAQVDLLVAAE